MLDFLRDQKNFVFFTFFLVLVAPSHLYAEDPDSSHLKQCHPTNDLDRQELSLDWSGGKNVDTFQGREVSKKYAGGASLTLHGTERLLWGGQLFLYSLTI